MSMLRPLSMLILALIATPAFGSDEIGVHALDEDAYRHSRDGVVQLVCTNEVTGQRYLSRAVVLQLPGFLADYDVLLAARHGVMDRDIERDCQIRGERVEIGAITRISTSTPAANEIGDFSHDWAIIRTRGRLAGPVTRLRAAVYDGPDQGQISMLRTAIAGEPCEITAAPDRIVQPTLIFHDCFSRPGLSGSPLLVQIDGEPFVIGLQLGEYIMLNESGQEYSVGRRIGDEFLQALVDFITEESRG
jgi:hypothetical protein